MGLPANASAEVLSPFTRVGLLRSNKSISSIKCLSHACYFQNSTNAMHPASAKSPASKSLSSNPSDSPSLSHTSSSIRALASHGILLQNAVPTHSSFQPWTCLGPLFYSIYFSSVFWCPRPPSVLKALSHFLLFPIPRQCPHEIYPHRFLSVVYASLLKNLNTQSHPIDLYHRSC